MIAELPAQLTYSSDDDPGITRKGAGRGFAFYDASGELIRDEELRERLLALAIPPAYTKVWYCPDPNGHLQATGFDSRGRKQYRYHPLWSEHQSRKKFNSLIDFGEALPRLRRSITHHIAKDDLSRDHVLATVARLLDKTAARVGNDHYFEENGTTGLTTLRKKNVDVTGKRVELSYTAKGGEEREFDLYQPRLASIIDELQELPGQRLFKYRSDAGWIAVDSGKINAWLKERAGLDITAKDFRTWRASALTLEFLVGCPAANSKKERISQEMEALRETSRELGHRPPVCRKHYVHPLILDHHRDGKLATAARAAPVVKGLSEMEARLLNFLKLHTL